MLDETRTTGKSVVIGAGTMGGGIAAQLANAGWQVHLLDLPTATETGKERNAVALAGLERLKKNRPPLLFLPEYAPRIQVGNTEDDLNVLADADWIVEAVAENLTIKQELFQKIAAQGGPETVVSSNTSGLSLAEMSAVLPADFRRRFLGTHFLNPPRYLKLLEVVPLPETDPNVARGFVAFAEQILGHRVAPAKDTPGFISTRLWIEHLLQTIRLTEAHGLTIEEADFLTGPFLGRPKSATFRMADIVGLDIIAAIARNQYESLPDDRYRENLRLPDTLARLLAERRTGEKSGAGFTRREGRDFYTLDFATLAYRPRKEADFPDANALTNMPLLPRLWAIKQMAGRWADFLNAVLDSLETYVTYAAPQIAHDVFTVDNVMQWGFGWESGPFAMRDARRQLQGKEAAYAGKSTARTMQVFGTTKPASIPQKPEYTTLAEIKAARGTVLESPVGSLIDLGDGVACLEYRTKMNAFDPELCAFVLEALDYAEANFTALVLANSAAHFSAGYNLKRLLDAAEKEDWSTIDTMMAEVQHVFQRLKYAAIPTVAAPRGYTLGAGCESVLHCTAIQAAPELTLGLPESKVGLLPCGGGIKELLLRAVENLPANADPFPQIKALLDLLALNPRNAANAHEARKLGILRPTDAISPNADRLLYDAKQTALRLSNGYQIPAKPTLPALGADGLARLRMEIHHLYRTGTLSEHARLVADHIATVLCGGNLPAPATVGEAHFLTLEREQFQPLIRSPKSQALIRELLT